MIYIWDNGGAYSNHSIDFIEVTDDIDREQAEIVMSHERWDQPEIVATVSVLEWRNKYGPQNFWDWFGSHLLVENYDNLNMVGPISVTWDWSKDRKWATQFSPLAGKLKLSFVLRALDEWKKRDAERTKTAKDQRAALENCRIFDERMRRLVELGIEHGMWPGESNAA